MSFNYAGFKWNSDEELELATISFNKVKKMLAENDLTIEEFIKVFGFNQEYNLKAVTEWMGF